MYKRPYSKQVLNTQFIKVYYIELPIIIRGFPYEIHGFLSKPFLFIFEYHGLPIYSSTDLSICCIYTPSEGTTGEQAGQHNTPVGPDLLPYFLNMPLYVLNNSFVKYVLLYHICSMLTSKYQVTNIAKNQTSSLGCYFLRETALF